MISTSKYVLYSLCISIYSVLSQTPCISSTSAPGTCFDCTYNYFRSPNMTRDKLIYSNNCSKRIDPSSEEINLFVSSIKCVLGTPCNGSKESPYDEINSAFWSAHFQANQKIFARVNIYFLTGPHYVLRKNLPQVSFPYFKRVNASIQIKPCFCSFANIAGCLPDAATVEIYMKTDGFNIFVANSVSISDITFYGWDLHLAATAAENNLTNCYNREETCCLFVNLNKAFNSSTNPCGLLKRNITLTTLESWDYRYGFLNLEPILDDPLRVNPSLTLVRTIFAEMYSSKPALSWIALIQFPSNVRGELSIINVVVRNIQLIKGVIFSKALEYLNPSTKNIISVWKEVNPENLKINLQGLLINQHNNYDVKLGTFTSYEVGMFSFDNFQGTFNLSNSTISSCLNSMTRLAAFSLYKSSSLYIYKVLFTSFDNFMFAYSEGSLMNFQMSNFTSSRIYDGFILKPDTIVSLINCIFDKVIAIVPATRFFIDTDTVFLTIRNVTMNYSQTSIRTYTSTLVIQNFSLSNVSLLRTFFQLKDGIFSMDNLYFFNVSSAPLTFRNLLFFSTVNPIVCSISNVRVDLFNGSTAFMLFDFLGSSLGFQMKFLNINIENSIVSTIIRSIQVEIMSIENIKASNVSVAISPGFSVIDSTFLEYLRVVSLIAKDIYSENSLIKVAYCLQSESCFFTLSNLNIINAARASTDWMVLSVPKVAIKAVSVYNLTYLPDYRGGASRLLILKNSKYVSIDTFSLLIFGDSIKCIFEMDATLEVNISNLDIQNLNESAMNSGSFFVSVISSKDGSIFNIRDVIVKNLRGRPLESEMKYKNGFINIFASDTDAVRNLNQIYLQTCNISVSNSGGWPNGAIGFINLNKIDLQNYTLKNTFAKKGGAIHINWAKEVTILNVYFNDVRAELGGAVYCSNVIKLGAKGITTTNSSATNEGGVFHISNIGGGSIQDIRTNCSSAGVKGGVFYLNNVFVQVTSIVSLNATSDDEAGVIFHSLGKVRVSTGYFSYLLSKNGGFGSMQSSASLILEYIQIYYSYSLSKGSSLSLFEVLELKIMSFLTIGNNGKSAIGNICIESQSVTSNYIQNIACYNNEILIGNCVYYNALGELNILDGNFSFNGGNIFQIISKNLSSLIFSNCIITYSWIPASNEINSYSIAYFKKADIVFKGKNTFANNLAKQALISFESVTLSIENLEIKNNSAFQQGIALTVIIVKLSKAIFKNILFSNERKEALVSFLANKHSNYYISQSAIRNCRSVYGCITAENSTGSVTDTILENNIGESVSAIYSLASNLTLLNSVFRNNHLTNRFNSSSLSIDSTLSSSDLKAADIFSESPLISTSLEVNIRNCTFDTYYGLSIVVFKIKILKIDLGRFQSFFGSGLFVFSSNSIVKNSQFYNLNDVEGAAIKFYNFDTNNIYNLQVTASQFINNTATLGGAIFIQGFINCTIETSNFTKNKALLNPGIGGVLYFTCLHCYLTVLKVIKNYFLDNWADNYAPTIFSQAITTDADTNNFENNKDNIGLTDKISSLPLSIVISDIIDFETKKKSEEIQKRKTIISGRKLDFNITVVDYFGQRLIFESESLSNIKKMTNELIVNGLGRSTKGLHQFKEVKIYSKPDSNFSLEIALDFDERKILNKALEINPLNKLSVVWDLFSRSCLTGEIFILADLSCYKCPEIEYSLVDPMLSKDLSSQETCKNCPENGICLGGPQLSPKQGYWRANNKSTLMVECLSKDFCLGGGGIYLTEAEKINGRCLVHHSGAMCYVCSKGFARAGSKSLCEECRSNAFLIFKVILTLLALIVYVVVQINLNFSSEGKSSLGILMKQLLTHAQLIQMISVIDLGWTPDILDYFRYQQYFSFLSEEMVSLDCVFEGAGNNILVLRVISTNLLPLMMTVLMMLMALFKCEFNYRYRKIERNLKKVKLFVKTSVVINIYIFFPEILRKSFSLLNCIQIDDVLLTEVVNLSPDLICWEEKHMNYVLKIALPGIIIWGIIIPITSLLLMLWNGKKIVEFIDFRKHSLKITDITSTKTFPMADADQKSNSQDNNNPLPKFDKIDLSDDIASTKKKRLFHMYTPENKKINIKTNQLIKGHDSEILMANDVSVVLKFLYKGFKAKFYYWEFLVFLKKFIMIIISSYTGLFPKTTKATLLLVVNSLFLLAQARFRPFEVSYLNNIEYTSLLVTFFTANIGIMLISADLKPYSLYFLIILIVCNLLFIIYWLLTFWMEALKHFRRKARK